jgi:hypothetical protein
MTLYWLSFADAEKPKGEQWLGGTFVEVKGSGKDGLAQAIVRAHNLGINPGGQIKSMEVPAAVTARARQRAVDDGSFEKLVGRDWVAKHGERI